MIKQVIYKPKGIHMDLSVSSFNPDYAYRIDNMRIINYEDNTLMSLVNEKGTKEINIDDTIIGTPIGLAVLQDTMVLFTTDVKKTTDKLDYIYRITYGNPYKSKLLYNGNLGFDVLHPIETLPLYENKELQKVYWTDGINPLRFINIMDEVTVYNDNSFDFAPALQLKEKVDITRLDTGGYFAAGTIQYALTYYNKYGIQTNVVYVSSLYYISYANRGAPADEKPTNCFRIKVDNLDNNFEFVRIYSIHRTSYNAIPEVKIVTDIRIPDNKSISYLDNGQNGEIIDPTELLYAGSEIVTAGTMCQKDGTLFLGDINMQRHYIDENTRELLRRNQPFFVKRIPNYNGITGTAVKGLNLPEGKGQYPYENQLKYSQNIITIFKYLEWYRFGIQFQHYTGKWSEAIWLGDIRNTVKPELRWNSHLTHFAFGRYDIPDEAKAELIKQGYIKARGVVVYPGIEERECVCQGVLNPTVYFLKDRYTNSPFAQASWFFRPNWPFDFQDYLRMKEGNKPSHGSNNSNNDIRFKTMNIAYVEGNRSAPTQDGIQYGTYVAYAHDSNGPATTGVQGRIAEIQGVRLTSPYIDKGSDDKAKSEFVDKYSAAYFVDQSIVTLNSPDLQFDEELQNLDISSTKLRITGIIPITSNQTLLDLSTSTAPNTYYKTADVAKGLQDSNLNIAETDDLPQYGWRIKGTNINWIDVVSGLYDDPASSVLGKAPTGFVVYPWQSQGSLNNEIKDPENGARSAKLKYNKRVNYRYSYNSQYVDENDVWKPQNGISDAQIFNSNETGQLRLKSIDPDNYPNINYYGNINKVLTPITDYNDRYPTLVTSGWQLGSRLNQWYYSDVNAYTNDIIDVKELVEIARKVTSANNPSWPGFGNMGDVIQPNYDSKQDPISMKYKSGIHAIIGINHTALHEKVILPSLTDGDFDSFGNVQESWKIDYKDRLWGDSTSSDVHRGNPMYPWDKNSTAVNKIIQDVYNPWDLGFTYYKGSNKPSIAGMPTGYLWLGELYREVDKSNLFGGQTEEAFVSNNWLVAGSSIDLREYSTIAYMKGDCYYQRYDALKTYPFTFEDQNQITEILSFMCESHVNIDGRTDRNRGTANLNLSPTNFNLFNNVYNNKDNFYEYHSLNLTNINLSNFTNTITWTKTKTNGEDIDTWTNITLASTLDLDGDKGNLTALRRYNSNIIAFQYHGIAQVLYNENTQISTTEGVPVEIANSGKVQGFRYIDDTIGCQVKESIAGSSRGLYFVDNISKGIYLLGQNGLQSLSDSLGLRSWVYNTIRNTDKWNPKYYNGIISWYDDVNKNVMFITQDTCLSYSENLQQFEGFYSYGNTPYIATIGNDTVLVSQDDSGELDFTDNTYKLWKLHGGDYNYFYNKFQPYSVTYIANPEVNLDKVFYNIEYEADKYSKNDTMQNYSLESFKSFDTLKIWNEYQTGSSTLNYKKNGISNLKKKFRKWYANIPREDGTNNRIRNNWAYLSIGDNIENNDKSILHYMVVKYGTLQPVSQQNNNSSN